MYNKVLEIVVDLCQDESLREKQDINLIDNDIIDSMAFIQIIDELEEEFDIQIQPTRVPPEVWETVKNIADFVESKVKEKNHE